MSPLQAGTKISAYERFVDVKKTGLDPAGLIAYGIYKTLKREWAIEKSQEQGRLLRKDETSVYFDILTPLLEQQIKSDANDVLKIFAADAVDKEAANTIRLHLGKNTFWKDVFAGIIAAAF